MSQQTASLQPLSGSARPIFLQAMWQTGSTYIWKKFREQRKYRAYCEPLHECLIKPQGHAGSVRGPLEASAVRQTPVDEFYGAEFPLARGGGAEHFRKPLSYERYCLEETEADEELYAYLANLIAHAARLNQQPVFPCNRALLRAGWLARRFAPVQILLLRNPLSVWKSFGRFPGNPFLANLCLILGQNGHKHPLKHLPQWVEFPHFVSDSFDKEFAFYHAFMATHQDRLYPSFFDFFVLCHVYCAKFADCILDLDEISANPAARELACARLRELGIETCLDDCALPSYAAERTDGEWQAYEDFSLSYLAQALPPELSIPKEKFEAFRPALSPYFRALFSGFCGRAAADSEVPAGASAAEKHGRAVQQFHERHFESAANLLGSAVAEAPTSELWNDWATAQNACQRRRLAELGFRMALRFDPPDREAAGNLGALLFANGRFREALPLLQAAELEANEQTRPIVSEMVDRTRAALGFAAHPPAPARASAKPAHPRGLTIFLSGLSASGKSTIAETLKARLQERDGRAVILLDGDVVRKHLSPELGFSREHRDLNIRRVGFVAARIVQSGGIAICSCIAPYDAARKEARAMVEACGDFLLVHVATPIQVCEQRDRKGLYARARAGLLLQFTGISDPYEPPPDAEVTVDTASMSPQDASRVILDYLILKGWIKTPAPAREPAFVRR